MRKHYPSIIGGIAPQGAPSREVARDIRITNRSEDLDSETSGNGSNVIGPRKTIQALRNRWRGKPQGPAA